MGNTANINVANDVGAVSSLRNIARQDNQQALKAAAKQFEAIMLQQLLKASRETRWDDGFGEDAPGVGSMDSYREWRDDQFAQTLSAQGSLGFADMLVKQLSPVDAQAKPATAMSQLTQDIPASTAADMTMSSNNQPVPTLKLTQASHGWWKVPAVDAPQSAKTSAEVAMPSTEETLLLRQMLQGKITQPTQG